ncbi:GIN domain-containing protein [Rhizobium sp. NPDC090279]|uniref:GIN domain-containing protein n=1 Tax=Rhizobium sp. NPDC090279 TaxID=3364499 RepID=UPI00383AE254
MNGKLATVATTGLICAFVFLALGIGLSGPDWANAGHWWGGVGSDCAATASGRNQIVLPFSSNGSLAIDIPATVQYQPGGKAEAVVSGDPALLDHVKLEGGRLSLDCNPGWSNAKFDVSLSGPLVTDWKVRGSGDLALSELDQTDLRLSITGSGSVVATGSVKTVDLDVSGSGAARLKDLAAQSVKIRIRGSGDAEVAAAADADISISGSGNIELYGHPVLRRSVIRGSGRLVQVP